MKFVYLIQHAYYLNDCDETKIIGIYTSLERAKQAIERIKTKQGFIDKPEDFHIDKYELDNDNWTEGFETVYE